jgi:hypothetical protein
VPPSPPHSGSHACCSCMEPAWAPRCAGAGAGQAVGPPCSHCASGATPSRGTRSESTSAGSPGTGDMPTGCESGGSGGEGDLRGGLLRCCACPSAGPLAGGCSSWRSWMDRSTLREPICSASSLPPAVLCSLPAARAGARQHPGNRRFYNLSEGLGAPEGSGLITGAEPSTHASPTRTANGIWALPSSWYPRSLHGTCEMFGAACAHTGPAQCVVSILCSRRLRRLPVIVDHVYRESCPRLEFLGQRIVRRQELNFKWSLRRKMALLASVYFRVAGLEESPSWKLFGPA